MTYPTSHGWRRETTVFSDRHARLSPAFERSGFVRRTLAAILLLATPVAGAEFALPETAPYRENVPTPTEFVGFPPGERHWTHDDVDEYVRALANASDRVELTPYATTHGGKPLVALVISSPENLDRLDELAEIHRKFADAKNDDPPKPEDVPLVVWFEYGVHGDEPSATHAGVSFAYYLAATEEPRIAEFLAKNVILVDPCLNPEGFDRFSRWTNGLRGKHPSADPQSREHQQAWPPGRVNYYGFDLNRDWLPAQQPESQGRLELYRKWLPNVLFDFHEMGTESTYFFQPGVPSRNNPLTPARNYELTRKLSDYYARALDEVGDLYFTEEKFDDFYPGKGSTYPDLHGGVGVLFEQSSARGVVQESRGRELTLAETTRRQIRTSLAALDGVISHRDEFVEWQRTFYREAWEASGEDPTVGYLVRIAHDPARRKAFAELLDRHGVEYARLAEPVERDGVAYDPDDSIYVPLRQRESVFAKALFERRTEFADSVFYDVSAWNLPAAFGAQWAEVSKALPEDALSDAALSDVRDAADELPIARAAYLIDLRSSDAYSALSRLFEIEVRPRVAAQPFAIEVAGERKEFPPGTIMIAVGEQDVASETIRDALAPLADDGLDVVALDTSRTLEGADLGSDAWQAVEPPKVALVCGKDVSPYDAADFWFALDRRADLPISLLDLDDLYDASFGRYDVIVFPDGDYRRFPGRKISDLTAWQRNGGTVILQGRAISWGATQGLAVVSEPSVAPSPTGRDPLALPQKQFADAADDQALDEIAGVILKARVDPTHPIGYGFDGSEAYVFRSRTLFFEPSKNLYSNPLVLEREPVVAGYVSPRNRERLSGGLSVTIQYYGEGRTILFADEPCFRAYFRGSERAFLNAVYFGSLIDDPS